MASTITDIAYLRLLTVLKDHRKETARKFFRAISPRIKDKIIEACGDIKWMYAKLVEEELPVTLLHLSSQYFVKEPTLTFIFSSDKRYNQKQFYV